MKSIKFMVKKEDMRLSREKIEDYFQGNKENRSRR